MCRNKYYAKLIRYLLLALQYAGKRKDYAGYSITAIARKHPLPNVGFGSFSAPRDRQKSADSVEKVGTSRLLAY